MSASPEPQCGTQVTMLSLWGCLREVRAAPQNLTKKTLVALFHLPRRSLAPEINKPDETGEHMLP